MSQHFLPAGENQRQQLSHLRSVLRMHIRQGKLSEGVLAAAIRL